MKIYHVYTFNDYVTVNKTHNFFTTQEIAKELIALAEEFSKLPQNSLVGMEKFMKSLERKREIKERFLILSGGRIDANDTLRGTTCILHSEFHGESADIDFKSFGYSPTCSI